nr:hypothetical protein [Tanacetum cinerariifolium]
MSDSDESGVTYTDISSPFEELSDIGSPRADDHEHLMLPEMLKDPYVEEDPVDYLADGGDDGDDKEESSEDDEVDEDDDMDVEADEEEKEEHPAPADSVVVAPTAADQEDRPEVNLPPRKRLDIALGLRYEVGESSSAAAAYLTYLT